MSEEKIDVHKRHNPEFPYTAAEAADRMLSAVSANPGVWNEAIQKCAKDIVALAASDEAEANFKAAMTKALAELARQKGLKETTTTELKRICAEKSGSWDAGVSAKREKVRKKVGEAVAVTYDVSTEVLKMKKGLPGSAERKARMTAYFDKRVAAKKARGT